MTIETLSLLSNPIDSYWGETFLDEEQGASKEVQKLLIGSSDLIIDLHEMIGEEVSKYFTPNHFATLLPRFGFLSYTRSSEAFSILVIASPMNSR